MVSFSRRNFLRAGAGASAAALAGGCGQSGGSSGARRDTVAILNKDIQAVRNFNVFSATAHSYSAEGLIFEAVARIDTFHGAKVLPWLASGWKFTEGGKALTFTYAKESGSPPVRR